ncbi:hypothetical protein [Flagellimonas allohymeniacidonis]|uniref:Uncharacterized protein n=1 Tax=Flagellimonas allohymeniacidonis TaxID=2517819 RepID=A0A4Q8QG24_9FLAO|nr:hypothetical protein [Allomuricauda hymeniacidonis]TAI48158.1 hypothetical protein EW142_16060 [Allomuricauda hymeniacidonis]
MRRIVLVAAFLFSLVGFAQIANPNQDSFNELAFFVGINNSIYDDAKGSRYLNDEFLPAKINNLDKVYPVRFNVVENTIEVKNDDGTVMSLDKSMNYIVRLMDGSYKFYEDNTYITENGRKEKSFFEKIHRSENYELFLKERIKFIPKKPSKSSYEPEVPAKFQKQEDKYYVKQLDTESGDLIEIPQKKKAFLKKFKEGDGAFDSFVKKAKSKFNNKEDLVKVLDAYYGTTPQ